MPRLSFHICKMGRIITLPAQRRNNKEEKDFTKSNSEIGKLQPRGPKPAGRIIMQIRFLWKYINVSCPFGYCLWLLLSYMAEPIVVTETLWTRRKA